MNRVEYSENSANPFRAENVARRASEGRRGYGGGILSLALLAPALRAEKWWRNKINYMIAEK